MNMRSVLFCGLVTCGLGAVMGLAVAEINSGDRNPKSHLHYSIAGAAIGLIMGFVQEAIRQDMQAARDEEDTPTS
ncbi:MAG: hypothetical protein MJA27_21145 [Pseudanabaenales cyanobacterium]|nr:hypothetical protein [Pseudanabaenales cyanobacterium]